MPTPVVLNVYDLDDRVTKNLNIALKPVASGAYHAAVEIFGREWSFGAGLDGTGVFCCEPRGCDAHSFREAIPMGNAEVSEDQFLQLLEDISREWQSASYNLLRRNCCHFSVALCDRLKVGPAPAWLTTLCGAGAALDDVARARPILAARDQGKLSRGATLTDDYQFGDVSRGVTVMLGQVANDVLVEGKTARGASGSDGYQFGDFTRGIVTGLQKQASGILSDGRAARGASESAGYAFGDVPRGLVARLGR